MAKLRVLDLNTCDKDDCEALATHAVDTDSGLYDGSYCLEHAKLALAKVQAEEDAGTMELKGPDLTLDEFRALFKAFPG
jgi:hypothetical protein